VSDQGFRLYGEQGPFYPLPTAYQSKHMALIKHVADMPFKEWARELNSPDRADDPLLIAALIAVAAWQANPNWTREQAYKFGDDLDMSEVELVGFEDEGDAVPPAESVDAASSSDSSTP